MVRLMVCHYDEFPCKIRTFYKSFKNLDEVAKLIVFNRCKWSLVGPKQTIKDLGKNGTYILYSKMDSLRKSTRKNSRERCAG